MSFVICRGYQLETWLAVFYDAGTVTWWTTNWNIQIIDNIRNLSSLSTQNTSCRLFINSEHAMPSFYQLGTRHAVFLSTRNTSYRLLWFRHCHLKTQWNIKIILIAFITFVICRGYQLWTRLLWRRWCHLMDNSLKHARSRFKLSWHL